MNALHKHWRVVAAMLLALSIPAAEVHSQERGGKADTSRRAPGPTLDVLRAQLSAPIDSIVDQRGTALGDNATIGVVVADALSGETLVDINGDAQFLAASNAKLVTAAAALHFLGPDFRFRTELLATTVDGAGRIPGDLYIRGRGNPLFGHQDLQNLADKLKSAGITRVDGNVVVDNSYFDTENLPPHFDEQPTEYASFRAPIAATSIDFNGWTMVVRPSLSGVGPARIELTPDNDYVVVNSSINTVRSGRTRLRMDTRIEPKRLVVGMSGQIREEVRQRRFRRRVDNPVPFVGSALRRALIEKGITVRGTRIGSAQAPDEAVQLALHESPPLAVAIRGMGKYSNNFVAEMLLKVIGAETKANGQPASWEHGLAAVGEFLDSIGIEAGSYRMGNGSGLFDSNRFTPAQMVKVLHAAKRNFRWGPDFLSSLSNAGTDGTLRNRMTESVAQGQVRAKTGTLDGISALSGVAAVDGRSPLLFSVLVNGFPKSSIGIARATQDEIAETLIQALGGK